MRASALKWLVVAVAALGALAAAALAAVPWLVSSARLQSSVAHAAGHALGRPVRVSAVSVSVVPRPSLALRGLSVGEDPRFGSSPFLTAEDGRVSIRVAALFLGRVEPTEVALDGVRLALVEDGGQWNVATLGPSTTSRGAGRGAVAPGTGTAAGPTAAIRRVRVTRGTVEYRRLGAPGTELRLESVTLDLTRGARPDLLTLAGDAEGRPGPVRLRIAEGEVTLPPSRLPSEAAVRALIQVEATDLRPLAAALLGPTELAGALAGDIRLRGTLGRLAGDGELRATRVAVAPARPRCGARARQELALEQVRLPMAFGRSGVELSRAEARAGGGGTVSAQLGLKLSPTPRVSLAGIALTGVQLEPILADYACQPYAISGALDLTGEAALAPGDPWRTLTGQGQLRVGRGRLLGAGLLALLRQAEALERQSRARRPAATPPTALPAAFDSIAGTYRIASGVLSSHDIEYESGGLRATAAGTYRIDDGWMDFAVTLAQGPATRVRARVTGAPGAVAITPLGVMRGEASLPAAPLGRTAR